MKIKNIKLNNKLILAPMAGYTDLAFRYLCKLQGASLTVTEMVSAKALSYNSKKTYELLQTHKFEGPIAVQIFGNDPEIMALACKNEALQKFDIIDINMGCPSPKIVKNSEGSALMKNINLSRKIIEACVEATDKPITVKFRTGWDEESINAVEFAKMCEKAGASAIGVHGRTRSQFYAGMADYDIIKAVKEAVNIPVMGNGDIIDKESYDHMLKYTGVDAVMIGRAAVGNPWVFKEVLGEPVKKDKLAMVISQINLLKEAGKTDRYISLVMRKHISQYINGEEKASAYRKSIFTAETLEEMLKLLEEVFA